LSDTPLPVIVNRGGGTASAAGEKLADQLREAFDRPIALELVDGAQIAAALARHEGAPRIVVGGGDGTIAAGAAAAMQSGAELAVLPLGTRNHFARQLGLPLDLVEAARTAGGGIVQQVDLADAGGHVFINNASVGAYPEAVRRRKHLPLPKGPATVLAGWAALAGTRSRRIELEVDGRRETVDTPLLFVGNNRYEVSDGHPGERDALDDGCLSCYALAPLTRWGLLRAGFGMLIGQVDMQRDFAFEALAGELTIRGPGGEIDIALDGEPKRLPLPLRIKILPRALKVVVATPDSD
jgi:diacylglycerol kinase family enzyme